MVTEEKRRHRQQLRKIWKEEAMSQEFISCDKRNEINSRREDREEPEIVGDGCRRCVGRKIVPDTIKVKKY